MQSEDTGKVISSLDYIGRTIAQQDAMRLRQVHALESLAFSVTIVALLLSVICTALVAMVVQ
jgi:type IV secretory pathway component VirB8